MWAFYAKISSDLIMYKIKLFIKLKILFKLVEKQEEKNLGEFGIDYSTRIRIKL